MGTQKSGGSEPAATDAARESAPSVIRTPAVEGFVSRFASVNGVRLHYVVGGAGGAPGSAAGVASDLVSVP